MRWLALIVGVFIIAFVIAFLSVAAFDFTHVPVSWSSAEEIAVRALPMAATIEVVAAVVIGAVALIGWALDR